LFYCTRYSTSVSNDSDTHDDFKPANKLEGSGSSYANVIEQVMVYQSIFCPKMFFFLNNIEWPVAWNFGHQLICAGCEG